MTVFKAACLQVNASNDMNDNIYAVTRLAFEARAAGANYEDARAQVERNEQRLRDIAADIQAKV